MPRKHKKTSPYENKELLYNQQPEDHKPDTKIEKPEQQGQAAAAHEGLGRAGRSRGERGDRDLPAAK